jgi:hypothetical protein
MLWLCRSIQYYQRLSSPNARLLQRSSLAIAHSHNSTTSKIAMPEVTNRAPSRSPSPPPKRARIDGPSVTQTTTSTTDTLASPPLPTTFADNAISSTSAKPAVSTDSTLAEQVEAEMNLPLEYPPTEVAGRREIVYEDKLVLAPMVRTGSRKLELQSFRLINEVELGLGLMFPLLCLWSDLYSSYCKSLPHFLPRIITAQPRIYLY